MVESCYFVQNVQLFKGRQDSRRGGNDYKNFLEGKITKHLIEKYKGREVVIRNDLLSYLEVEDLDIDMQFLRIAFGEFDQITVGPFGLHVRYS